MYHLLFTVAVYYFSSLMIIMLSLKLVENAVARSLNISPLVATSRTTEVSPQNREIPSSGGLKNPSVTVESPLSGCMFLCHATS